MKLNYVHRHHRLVYFSDCDSVQTTRKHWATEVVSSEDVPVVGLQDDELSHKQKAGITVNCSQICNNTRCAPPPMHVLRHIHTYVRSTGATSDTSTLAIMICMEANGKTFL